MNKVKIATAGCFIVFTAIWIIFIIFGYVAYDKQIKQGGCIVTNIQKDEEFIYVSKHGGFACYDQQGTYKVVWWSGSYSLIKVEYVAPEKFGKPDMEYNIASYTDCYYNEADRDRVFDQIKVNMSTNVCFYNINNPAGVSVLKSTQLAGNIAGLVIFTFIELIILIAILIIFIWF